MLVASERGILKKMLGHFPAVCGNKTGQFCGNARTFFSFVRGYETVYF